MQRGLVSVKGKGQLMTYYLRDDVPLQQINTTATVTNSNSDAEVNIKVLDDLDSDLKTPLLNLKTSNGAGGNCSKVSSPGKQTNKNGELEAGEKESFIEK